MYCEIVRMARPLRVHIPHAYYHVMSRGNAKQSIFHAAADYERFLEFLESTSSRFGVLCCAYCLMPNHFHLVLEPDADPLSRMMQQLNSGYSQWFNRQHDRVGHVLQGRFKALLVDRDSYFLQLLRYIMLNPIEANLVDDPGKWRWSSYRATAGLTEPPSFLALDDVWKMFDVNIREAQRRFVAFVAAGRGQPAPPEAMVTESDALRAEVGTALEPYRHVRDFSRKERYAVRPHLESLLESGHDHDSRLRAMADAYWRYGYTLREIGALLGCHESTVLRRIHRTGARTPSNGLRARVSEPLSDDARIKI
jgi:REP element-mobilizing transposase RayT